jgi:hypothetical protein
MKKIFALFLYAATGQAAQMSPVVADELPKFDIEKSFHVDVRAYGAGDGKTSTCITEEQKAKETRIARSDQFTPKNRSECLATVSDIAGMQSYVEFLTCLQAANSHLGDRC